MQAHTSIHEGMKVHSRDGADLGKVVRCTDEWFVIEQGLFFPKDYTARYEYVSDVREPDDVFLLLSKDDLAQGQGQNASESEPIGTPETAETAGMPIAEEQLEAEKRTVTAGEVRISKDVVTEQESVTAPVTREVERVERAPASGPAPEGSLEPGEIRIPVQEEHLKETQTGQETVSGEVKQEIPNIESIEKEGQLRDRPPRKG